MLKKILIMGGAVFVFVLTVGFTAEDKTLPLLPVKCSPNYAFCTVGGHTMSTNVPGYIAVDGQTDVSRLVVGDGVVCAPNRKICTNGYRTIHSTEEIELVSPFVLCGKSRKVCTVGRHVMRSSSKPLYVDGSGRIVCSADKKTCTNGYKYEKSSKPLF